MKIKKVKLADVIRDHYEVAPLQHDLSQTVADKIFGPKPAPTFVLGKWVYYVIGVLLTTVLVITLSYLVKLQLSPSYFLIIVPVMLYFFVSMKEAKALERYSKHVVS